MTAALEVMTELYRTMRRIRAFEDLVSSAYGDGRLGGLVHLSHGGEAVAAGVTTALRPGDKVYTGHRGHGHFLAAGAEMGGMFNELVGTHEGICRGFGGSMHLMDTDAVMATGVVGGTLPIALGHAISFKDDSVVVCFFGDGAVQSGVFHETMNLAALWKAPVLFVCENNGWVEFSKRSEHTKVDTVRSYGDIYGFASATVDGRDVEGVFDTARDAVVALRAGEGPFLLECVFDRIRPHYEGDMRKPDRDAVDPIDLALERLRLLGAEESDIDRIGVQASAEAEAALDSAMANASAAVATD